MCARHVSVSILLTYGSYSDAMCWTPSQTSVDGSGITPPASDAVTHLSEVRMNASDSGECVRTDASENASRTRPE